MDLTDRHIINLLQDGLPIHERPFAEAAEKLGLDEESLIARVRALLDSGVLSRFGPMYDAERMGGAFSLCAMQVPPAELDAVADKVNAHPEIAHNYEREHPLNLWFVVGAERPGRIPEVIAQIEAETGHRVHDMPKLAEYRVRLRLDARRIAGAPAAVPAH